MGECEFRTSLKGHSQCSAADPVEPQHKTARVYQAETLFARTEDALNVVHAHLIEVVWH